MLPLPLQEIVSLLARSRCWLRLPGASTASAGLNEAVRSVFVLAVPGHRILLSPGFASFDLFRGYDDRGQQFEKIADNL